MPPQGGPALRVELSGPAHEPSPSPLAESPRRWPYGVAFHLVTGKRPIDDVEPSAIQLVGEEASYQKTKEASPARTPAPKGDGLVLLDEPEEQFPSRLGHGVGVFDTSMLAFCSSAGYGCPCQKRRPGPAWGAGDP